MWIRLSAASAGNLPIKADPVYNAAAEAAIIEQQSVPHIVMLDSEWATSTSRGNGSTLLLKIPPLDAPSFAQPEPFVAPIQTTLDQLREKWNARMASMGHVAIPKKKKGKPFLLPPDSCIPIHGTVVFDRIRSVDARQLTCGISLPELIERLSARFGASPSLRDADEPVLPTMPGEKDLAEGRACKFVVARTTMSGDSELGPDASVDAHPCNWDKKPDFLEFESRFESGNLRRAVKVSGTDNEYDLVLSPDMNTYGHTQWFFFRVRGMAEGQHYKFNIVNLEKSDSLYNMGLRPLMFSERTFAMQGVGWFRCGHNIAYFSNGIRRLHRSKTSYYQTLTFTFSTPYANDTIYLAHCYPYTFSMLKEYVHRITTSLSDFNIVKCKSIGESLAGNNIYCLTVTNFKSSPEAIRARRGVMLSARVHPGESNSSYMMKGAIDFLLSSSPEAQRLREVFVFKIVPMINPDGVACGNYRCSLSGHDLNRRWKNPGMLAHPEIYNLRIMLKRFQEDRPVVMFCDLHGHSRKYDTFIYACNPKYWKTFFPASEGPPKYLERLLPKVLNKLVPSFSYDGCAYSVSKSKEGTGRVTVWKEFKIFNAFTMEASFAGTRGPSPGMESAFSLSRASGTHYGRVDLEELGSGLCVATCLVWASDSAVSCAIGDRINNVSKARGDHEHVTSSLAEILALSDSDGDGQDSSSDDNVILDPTKMLGGDNLKSKILSMASAFKHDASIVLKLDKKAPLEESVAVTAENRTKKRDELKPAAKPMR
jgi:cytosolic carboxypeptidase protein 2/3